MFVLSSSVLHLASQMLDPTEQPLYPILKTSVRNPIRNVTAFIYSHITDSLTYKQHKIVYTHLNKYKVYHTIHGHSNETREVVYVYYIHFSALLQSYSLSTL